MRKRYALISAAAIAIGGLVVPQTFAQDDPNKGPAERTGEAIDNTGRKAGDAIDRGLQGQGTVAAPDAEGIRDVLAQVAEAHGKTRDQLKAALAAQYGQSLDSVLDSTFPARPARPAATPTGSAG